MKKSIPTILLKLAVIIVGILLLAFCIFLLPNFANELSMEFSKTSLVKYSFLTFTYLAVSAFFYILYQIIMLLNHVDASKFFSESSLKALYHIEIAGIISTAILYFVGWPTSYIVAQLEDAPGLIIIASAIFSVPLIIAIFSIVLQRLVREVIVLKKKALTNT